MALYGANKTTTPQALPNKKDCKIDLSEPRSAFLNNRAMTIFSYRPVVFNLFCTVAYFSTQVNFTTHFGQQN